MQEARVRPPLRPAVANALRFRCPCCRTGPVFRGWVNRMFRRCPHCGLSYFRESGYYLGGMILTYILTAFALLGVYLFTFFLPDVRFVPQSAVFPFWITLGILLTLAFVRPAYSLWLSLDFWFDPWEPDEPGGPSEGRQPPSRRFD